MDELRFFVDRSLGNHVVPNALRAAGWVVVTMRDRYGEVTAQQLADIQWIPEAAELGDVILTADKAIARRPLEALAVIQAEARVFALGNNQITGAQAAGRLIENERAIFRKAREQPGPYVVSVTGSGLQTVKLNRGGAAP
ncbi:MAG: hypothetical protein ABIO06_09715 [Pseudolysinimonas sp.]